MYNGLPATDSPATSTFLTAPSYLTRTTAISHKRPYASGAHIAPARIELNHAKTGGWAFISGVMEVLPGARRVVGGALSGSAAMEPLAAQPRFWAVPLVLKG